MPPKQAFRLESKTGCCHERRVFYQISWMHSVANENCNGREECKGTLFPSLLTVEVSSYSPAACCSHTPVLALVSASGGDEETSSPSSGCGGLKSQRWVSVSVGRGAIHLCLRIWVSQCRWGEGSEWKWMVQGFQRRDRLANKAGSYSRAMWGKVQKPVFEIVCLTKETFWRNLIKPSTCWLGSLL